MNDITKRFLQSVDQLGLSDYKVSKSVDSIKKENMSKIRNGLIDVSVKVVAPFCEFYGVDANWLLTGKGKMFLASDSVEDALNNEDLAKHASSIPVDPEMVNFYEDIIKRKDEEILKLQGEVYRLMMEIKKVSKGA
ncbi:helix-turn-helix transcriptional regulator [Parabacteroides hominis]|uniref:Helix-turn-helix transcriptional regulator n=1 Tax=Parabacteroides hominis TaxID=2763057 RepID=A0ABR7DKW3_9BACT|nr:helix-turn-helix transcriptional regulator [Parabacteroides hominis]MBC5632072.1 helix-turn-helix transcriptional regulator [Parabacteroides hominis]